MARVSSPTVKEGFDSKTSSPSNGQATDTQKYFLMIDLGLFDLRLAGNEIHSKSKTDDTMKIQLQKPLRVIKSFVFKPVEV